MTQPHQPTANFDLIARPYRWLEYLTFGPALSRCRTHFLPKLAGRRNALVLGDGDGRFLARLLSANPHIHANAVDASAIMLRVLTRRAHAAHSTAAARLCCHQLTASAFAPAGQYDLIVTHFFLDCLTQAELNALTDRLAPHLAANALWLVSDFRIPTGLLRLPARILVRSLYFAFRLFTGLRTTRLPDHASALRASGLTLAAEHHSFAALLTSEMWAYTPAMQLPPQRFPAIPDPVPDPEPASPSLPEPDPGVFHREPSPASQASCTPPKPTHRPSDQ